MESVKRLVSDRNFSIHFNHVVYSHFSLSQYPMSNNMEEIEAEDEVSVNRISVVNIFIHYFYLITVRGCAGEHRCVSNKYDCEIFSTSFLLFNKAKYIFRIDICERSLFYVNVNYLHSPTSMDLDTAMVEAKQAIHYFFNNDFAQAKKILEPWSDTSVYHSLGNSTFAFVEAILTFEQVMSNAKNC